MNFDLLHLPKWNFEKGNKIFYFLLFLIFTIFISPPSFSSLSFLETHILKKKKKERRMDGYRLRFFRILPLLKL